MILVRPNFMNNTLIMPFVPAITARLGKLTLKSVLTVANPFPGKCKVALNPKSTPSLLIFIGTAFTFSG